MSTAKMYELAKEIYAELGVDTDAAIRETAEVPVSIQCWQGDDVIGFDNDGGLTGGIQTTGNYPGKARTPEELLADMDKAMSINRSILPIIREADSLTFPVGYKLLAKAKGLNTYEGDTPEQNKVLENIKAMLKEAF